jgi:hypothetical protein
MEPPGSALQLGGGLRNGLRGGLADQVQVDAETPQLALQLLREGAPQLAGQAGGAALTQHDLGDASAPGHLHEGAEHRPALQTQELTAQISAELFTLLDPQALIAAE